jgi:hypothetical protein
MLRVGALAGLLLSLSGCGTLFYGKTQTLSIASDPAGCEVRLAKQTLGVTPCQIKLDRRAPPEPGYRADVRSHYYLSLTHEGYVPQQVVISDNEVRSSDSALLNCFLGPFCLFGMTVDKYEGQWDRLSPDTVEVKLTPMNEWPGEDRTLPPAGHWEPVAPGADTVPQK